MIIEKPAEYKFYSFSKDGKKEMYLNAENIPLAERGRGWTKLPLSNIDNLWDVLTNMPGAMDGFTYHIVNFGKNIPKHVYEFVCGLNVDQLTILKDAVDARRKRDDEWAKETKELEEKIAKRMMMQKSS